MTKRRSTLIVCEKPDQFRALEPFWKEAYPQDDISVFYTPPIGSFDFDIPRDLPISSVPMIADLKLKPRKRPAQEDGTPSIFDRDFEAMAAGADHIVCATDCDPQGARNFLDLVNHYNTPFALSEMSWTSVIFRTAEEYRNVIKRDMRADSPFLTKAAGVGWAKQYFDYLYLINALPVFGQALRAVGYAEDYTFLSKFSLQTLFTIQRRKDGPFGQSAILMMMKGNHSSSRESPIGTPISMGNIFFQLRDAGLIEQINDDGAFKALYQLSDRAHRLLSLMHKDCFDPGLAARLQDWGETWPASKPQIERYIRTFFGKQKRFQGKSLSKIGCL